MRPACAVARKEILDGVRDVRSMMAALFYALMGPLVVGLVAYATHSQLQADSSAAVLKGMMAVFTLVSAFVGGMNVAMDTVAGERERRSLLPLLLNPVSRFNVAAGKWLAVSCFAVAGLAIDVLGFAVVFFASGVRFASIQFHAWLPIAAGLFALPFLAAAIQIWISTTSRAVKEAQTYLSLVVFLPMALGMFLIFHPPAQTAWLAVLPIVGQQLQIQDLMNGTAIAVWQPLGLLYSTLAAAFLLLLVTANRLSHDEIIYGN